MGPEAVEIRAEPSGLRLKEVLEIPPHHYAGLFEKVPP